MNSVPQYVPFFRVLRGCSSCVSKLSRVLFAFTGTSLREPGHDMDGLTIIKVAQKSIDGFAKALGRAASLLQ